MIYSDLQALRDTRSCQSILSAQERCWSPEILKGERKQSWRIFPFIEKRWHTNCL